MPNSPRSAFSTECPQCKSRSINETHSRPYVGLAMVPNSHEPLATPHYEIVKGFECVKCKHKWEEAVEQDNPPPLPPI
jgi:hypothetical protein